MKSLSLNMKQEGMRAFALSSCPDFPFSGFLYRKQRYMIIGVADHIKQEWRFEIRALCHTRQSGGAVFMPQKYDTWRVSFKDLRMMCRAWGLCEWGCE